jgi:tRNA(Arg) A34 adenosine deaminase TadA
MDYLAHAIELAVRNVEDGGRPFASVIVRDDEIIATGLNLAAQTRDPTAHAEILAIRLASQILGTESLRGCRLYTTCEPCPMCLGALYWAEPDHVTFAFPGPEAARYYHAVRRYHTPESFYGEYSLGFDRRRLPMTLEKRPEARDLFTLWKATNP